MSDEVRPSLDGGPEQRDDAVTRIIDRLADLLQTAVDWLRQEAEATVREKVVPPLQRLGLTLTAAIAAATLLVIGLIFIAVSGIMALGEAVGYVYAFLIIGAAFLIGSTVFLVIKVRSMQT